MGYDILIDAVLSSGPITLSIFISLVLLSIYSWTVLMSKLLQFKQEERENKKFLVQFDQEQNLKKLFQGYSKGKFTVNRGLISIFCETYLEVDQVTQKFPNLDYAKPEMQGIKGNLDEVIQRTLSGVKEREYNRLMKLVSGLATTSTIAPFVGLLGTVIGIINAFGAIGRAGSADLAFVAPAISEALIATALGLFVAIPASVGFNYLKNRSFHFREVQNRFGLQLQNRIQKQFLFGQAK
ncbi:MAG: hypothetical protein COB67_08005 [SAR324 cluster bacterium]|uniref:MotA/TolQ/ExbB proton channel domain-containing protein n=1 Tax=SAR324 cluster bacterium TaxID=2024889 RepID=A0A2A4T2Q4_9DELT|nr:MAG: hypothetical protein COB67_08005 [SAR324 cluster bacterium]